MEHTVLHQMLATILDCDVADIDFLIKLINHAKNLNPRFNICAKIQNIKTNEDLGFSQIALCVYNDIKQSYIRILKLNDYPYLIEAIESINASEVWLNYVDSYYEGGLMSTLEDARFPTDYKTISKITSSFLIEEELIDGEKYQEI